MRIRILTMIMGLVFLGLGIGQIAAAPKMKPLEPVPPEYAEKHMPNGWWTDPAILEEGRLTYEGKRYGRNVSKKKRVNCAKCHGADGKPVVKRTGDLSEANLINRMSENYLIWKISEGVSKTKMRPWRGKLTEEEIWKAIAYLHTFSHGGKAEVHDHPDLSK